MPFSCHDGDFPDVSMLSLNKLIFRLKLTLRTAIASRLSIMKKKDAISYSYFLESGFSCSLHFQSRRNIMQGEISIQGCMGILKGGDAKCIFSKQIFRPNKETGTKSPSDEKEVERNDLVVFSPPLFTALMLKSAADVSSKLSAQQAKNKTAGPSPRIERPFAWIALATQFSETVFLSERICGMLERELPNTGNLCLLGKKEDGDRLD